MLLVAAIVAIAEPAGATCRFVVDAAGGGTHTTIQAAVDALPSAGPCTIDVRRGTYHETLAIAGRNTFADREEARVRIVGAAGAVLAAQGDHAIVVSGTRFLTIEGLTVAGSRQEAIVIDGSAASNADVTIARNDIHNNGSGAMGGGILVGPGNARLWIVNNAIRSNGRNGIDVDVKPHESAGTYIVNNTIVGNGWNGVRVGTGEAIYLLNNLIVGNGVDNGSVGGRWGLAIDGDDAAGAPGLVTVQNNVFYRNGLRAAAASGGDIANAASVLESSDSGNVTTRGTEGTGVAGCVVDDCAGIPLSAFFAGADLRLAGEAHALRRGLASFVHESREWIPQDDIDGTPRDRAAGLDVGYHQRAIRIRESPGMNATTHATPTRRTRTRLMECSFDAEGSA